MEAIEKLKERALNLSGRTAPGSISPKDVGGLFFDTLEELEKNVGGGDTENGTVVYGYPYEIEVSEDAPFDLDTIEYSGVYRISGNFDYLLNKPEGFHLVGGSVLLRVETGTGNYNSSVQTQMLIVPGDAQVYVREGYRSEGTLNSSGWMSPIIGKANPVAPTFIEDGIYKDCYASQDYIASGVTIKEGDYYTLVNKEVGDALHQILIHYPQNAPAKIYIRTRTETLIEDFKELGSGSGEGESGDVNLAFGILGASAATSSKKINFNDYVTTGVWLLEGAVAYFENLPNMLTQRIEGSGLVNTVALRLEVVAYEHEGKKVLINQTLTVASDDDISCVYYRHGEINTAGNAFWDNTWGEPMFNLNGTVNNIEQEGYNYGRQAGTSTVNHWGVQIAPGDAFLQFTSRSANGAYGVRGSQLLVHTPQNPSQPVKAYLRGIDNNNTSFQELVTIDVLTAKINSLTARISQLEGRVSQLDGK